MTNPYRSPGAMQAHLGRAAKFSDGGPRSRAFFLFFRITGPERRRAWLAQIEKLLQGLAGGAEGLADEAASPMDRRPAEPAETPEDPAAAFRLWLTALTGGPLDGAALTADLAALMQGGPNDMRSPTAEGVLKILLSNESDEEVWDALMEATSEIGDLINLVLKPEALLPGAEGSWPLIERPDRFAMLLRRMSARLETRMGQGLAFAFMLSFSARLLQPGMARAALSSFGDCPAKAGRTAMKGGLPLVLLYETLREAAPGAPAAGEDMDATAFPPVLRDEAGQTAHLGVERRHDATPINMAFTHSGLERLSLDPVTLDTFPDVFKDGMAARAARLGDDGPSAPENWDGALGLKTVHGLVGFGFKCGSDADPTPEDLLSQLRRDVEAFNSDGGPVGAMLRALISPLFGLLGMEILHIEFGEDPYRRIDSPVGDVVDPLPHRTEHFGFRDGISQPFVDLSLETPAPGGGDPAPGGRWDPIAGGEIYLDQKDENGVDHLQPANARIQEGSTYIVFRKLAQDVSGFRAFLKDQRPNDPDAQERLAAEFVGRWKSGASLVVAPHEDVGAGDPQALNDFLYKAEDPDGLRCPLGAHARRSNPRDIGARGVVARHRILRRGISYGGALLEDGDPDDGVERGLLFIAANARIDTQFEVIQSDWINRGEFLGQAGLGRCPLIGSNTGAQQDRFVEAGATAPVTGVPRFVTTRGGDYFFAPGAAPLRAIAAGERFAPDADRIGHGHLSPAISAVETPNLFDEDRLRGVAGLILSGRARAVRATPPDAPGRLGGRDELIAADPPPSGCPMVFLARHRDVAQALTTPAGPGDGTLDFSVSHYRAAGHRLSRGHELPIGTEFGGAPEAAAARSRIYKILNRAWDALGTEEEVAARVAAAMQGPLDAAIARAAPEGRIDLVQDLAAEAAYAVVKDVFGVPGPDWVTQLALTLPFSKQQVTQLHPDWLAATRREPPEKPGLLTLQIWSIVMNVDIVANIYDQRELKALSLQCGSEMLTYLDRLLAERQAKRPDQPRHLVDWLIALGPRLAPEIAAEQPGYEPADYLADIRMILIEICGAAIAIAPMNFAAVMEFVLEHGIDLSLTEGGGGYDDAGPAVRLIYEATRLNPSFRFLFRRAARAVELEKDGVVEARIAEGDWIAALVQAANVDPEGPFDKPRTFSLSPFTPGPERNIDDYLLFGVAGGNRRCWGRERVALPVLLASLAAARRLGRLRPVAGAEGETRELAKIAIGLLARFPVRSRRR